MGKMTSTPYGLKVKEHTNHADYKDVFDKTVFKIYYNESTHVWSIIANYDRLWSEGIQYNVGDTILSFTNTSNQEKTVLGQYDQEGTEVYRNIMYKIKCYQGEAGQGQTKQMIQITGGYSPKTYDKDTVCTDILHTHVSVYYNGKWHKAMYLVYDNASIAGCWMKKVGSLAITYAYPYWFLMCTKAGLKQGDRTYAARELIRSWSQDDYINMSFKEYKIRSKTKLGKGSYEKGEYLVKTIPSEDSIEVDFIVNGKIENKDTIILGISDVPYDFYNIRINYESNEWSLISINGHISYNKHNYKKDAVICTLNKNEQITVTLIDNNDRYEKQQELNENYEETVYDIVGLPDSTYITVKNQTVVQELNPETGRTEKVYIDFDEKTIYQSDTMPSDFYNIRFIYTSSDNKWTIYSLCDYIKYGSRTYTKNKPILSFGTDEYDPEDPHPEVHLEIKDETEKYEIESTTTYTVQSVQVSDVSYKLWTVTIDKSLKIEKTVDTTVEPWISLRYYEAMYEPVVIDDLIIEFSNVDMKWYLKSNNDNLYCSGTNYQKGELITYWDYDYIQNLKYITVLSSSSEYGIELKKLTSGDVPYISEDIDEIYDEGLKICYSTSKGLWEIVSVDDETYYNGIQFLEGQTIVSFKDRTILDQFTILVKKIIPGEEEYDNVMYTCYTGVDLINGITTLTVNGMSWTDKSATDANKSVIVTKDTAKSMYGYIWQKETSPGPTPTPDHYRYYLIPIDVSGNNGYRYIAVIRIEFGHRYIKRLMGNGIYRRINANDSWIKVDYNDITDQFDSLFLMNDPFNFDSSYKTGYRYINSRSDGVLNESNWSYVSSFLPWPYNQPDSIFNYGHIIYKKIEFDYTRFNINTQYFYVIDHPRFHTIYVGKLVFSDSRYYSVNSENNYANKYSDDIESCPNFVDDNRYLDKGSYVLIYTNTCIIDYSSADEYQKGYSVFKLDYNTLEITGLYHPKAIAVQEWRERAISDYHLIRGYTRVANQPLLCFDVNGLQMYELSVYDDSDDSIVKEIDYAFKYNIETNEMSFIGEYRYYYSKLSGEAVIDERPWHNYKWLCNGKGYDYIYDNNSIIIYELENPFDFNCLFNGGEIVSIIPLETEVQLFNVITRTYETFMLNNIITYSVFNTETYDSSINKIIKYNYHGIFLYSNVENNDRLIIYLDDPTLKTFNGSFCFYASAMRNTDIFDEEMYVSSEPHNL